MSTADAVREKYRKILKQEQEEPMLDPGQLLLISWLIQQHDSLMALQYMDIAGLRLLERQELTISKRSMFP